MKKVKNRAVLILHHDITALNVTIPISIRYQHTIQIGQKSWNRME